MFNFFFFKELKSRYFGTASAAFWIIAQPLLLLTIYYFVFGYIFKARIAELDSDQFIVYLAVGLWPWLAFSDSVIRSVTSVAERKDLLGKVKLDLRQVVFANISVAFFLHVVGYSLVLCTLMVLGLLDLSLSLLLLFIPLLLMYFLAITLGLFFSALYIFFRDIQQIVTTLMTFLFFSTPIIYSIQSIPEKYHAILHFNPLFGLIDFIHSAAFIQLSIQWKHIAIWCICIPILLLLSNAFFKKLAPEFDDYI